MRLDDKLAALDNHAARRMHVSEWQHLRVLAAAEGDSRIVEECDYRIAKLESRTRARQAMTAVGRLREELFDLGRCEVVTTSGHQPAIAATGTGARLVVTVEIVVDAPDEAAP